MGHNIILSGLLCMMWILIIVVVGWCSRGGWMELRTLSQLGWLYVKGFGDLSGEFWIHRTACMSKIHRLTQATNTTLRVDLADFEGGKWYAKYTVFEVQDSSRKYIGEYSGDAGDSMVLHSGMNFTIVPGTKIMTMLQVAVHLCIKEDGSIMPVIKLTSWMASIYHLILCWWCGVVPPERPLLTPSRQLAEMKLC